jgi:predicted transcriptional regulator
MDDPLELDIRRKIYNLILKNPGIHFSKIAEILEIRTSLVDYHVLFLEKHDLISSDKETGYKRLYAKGKIGTKEKKYLFILRQKTLLNIVIQLLREGNLKHKEILDNVDVSPSTLSYHLKKLIKSDIIEENKNSKKQGYFIKNKQEIISILIQYKPYNLLDGFEDIWIDLTV